TGNLPGKVLAQQLDLGAFGASEQRIIEPPTIGYMVLGTLRRWCQSRDTELSLEHVALGEWRQVLDKNECTRLARKVHEASTDYLQFLNDPRNATVSPKTYVVSHDFYLKKFVEEVASGRVTPPATDVLMVDEFQDSNAVTLKLIECYRALGTKVVVVGDPYQQIYAWRGSENAFDRIDLPLRHLRQSFRFGPQIAECANTFVRTWLGSDPGIIGAGPPESRMAHLSDIKSEMVLCRSNRAVAITAMGLMDLGRAVYIKNGKQVALEVRDIDALMSDRAPLLPEYQMFLNADDLIEHAESEEGKRLKMLMGMIQQHGAGRLCEVLTNASTRPSSGAYTTVMTGHGAKGMEAASVRLHEGFSQSVEAKPESGARDEPPQIAAEEARLIYVAMTRASHLLDVSGVDVVMDALQRSQVQSLARYAAKWEAPEGRVLPRSAQEVPEKRRRVAASSVSSATTRRRAAPRHPTDGAPARPRP
ncbi:MAG: UvrD-helicase domain-containing protein, partial [Acidiferrobacteraceae bacterium]